MVRMKRGGSAEENGRKEEKPAPTLLCLLCALPHPFLGALLPRPHTFVSRLPPPQAVYHFGPSPAAQRRASAVGPHNVGVLVAVGCPTTR